MNSNFQMHPPFDIKPILDSAITEHRLIVSLPWIVQYMSMLDFVTLRLNYHRDILQVLYEIYIVSCQHEARQHLQQGPTSKFILRSSLGWLFDQPNVPDEYYLYRQHRKRLPNEMRSSELHDYREVRILVPSVIAATVFDHEGASLVLKSYKQHNTSQVECMLQLKSDEIKNTTQQKRANTHAELMDINLDGLLNTACPFLADFRVSIMPSRQLKTVSRSGRYRHITTKRSDNVRPTENDGQSKLIEAFLQSQSQSMRKMIEFVIERVSSAVIKDFQVEKMIPAKQSANDRIQELKALQVNDVKSFLQQIFAIFKTAQDELDQFWLNKIPDLLQQRVTVIWVLLILKFPY